MKRKKRLTRAQKKALGGVEVMQLKQQRIAEARKRAAQKLNAELNAANLER